MAQILAVLMLFLLDFSYHSFISVMMQLYNSSTITGAGPFCGLSSLHSNQSETMSGDHTKHSLKHFPLKVKI